MAEYKEYRNKDTTKAMRLEESGTVGTYHGPVYAKEGDYLVRGEYGVYLVPGGVFDEIYVELEGDNDWSPAGKTVEQVKEFLNENPDQVDRVRKLEFKGGNRKSVMEYQPK